MPDVITFDKEGFLENLEQWSTAVAENIAEKENIELADEHWQIINLTRDFHKQFQRSPNMRALVNYIKKQQRYPALQTQVSSIYLLRLFPESPAKIASKIAGLPKPDNCL